MGSMPQGTGEGRLLRWLRWAAPGCGVAMLLGTLGAAVLQVDLWQEAPLPSELTLETEATVSSTLSRALLDLQPGLDVGPTDESAFASAAVAQGSPAAVLADETAAVLQPDTRLVAVLDPRDRPAGGPASSPGPATGETAEGDATILPVSVAVGRLPAAIVAYSVAPGDTLSGVAARFGANLETVRAYNDLGSGGLLRVGQVLRIPTSSGPIHVVSAGETLYRIALSYGVAPRAVTSANELASDLIVPGQRLVIPGGVQPVDVLAASPSPPSPTIVAQPTATTRTASRTLASKSARPTPSPSPTPSKPRPR